MRAGVALLLTVAGASVATADTITLKGHQEPIHGQIVDETDATFVIEVRKDQITTIERNAPFVRRSSATTAQAVWEERDGYLIIQIPQEQVEPKHVATAGTAPLPAAHQPVRPQPRELPKPSAQTPGSTLSQADRRLGAITGRALWDGQPLAHCKVKAVMVSSPQPLAMVAQLVGRSEAHAEEGYVAEATTDASGRYRFDRVPPGEYDLYWQPRGQPASQWLRRLQEKPDLVVLEGEATTQPDIEAHVKTVN